MTRPSGEPRVTLLLVEDDPGDAARARKMLEEEPGAAVEVRWVRTLAEALDAVLGDEVEVVLLDLDLPDSRGSATLKTILGASPHLPVLVWTRHSDQKAALAALRQGAEEYLVKERMTGTALVRCLRYALERRRLAEEVARRRADFQRLIDLNADGMLAVDGEGVVRYANDAACRLLGRSREAVEGSIFGVPMVSDRWTEVEVQPPGGEERIVEMRTVPTWWEREEAQLVVLHDATARKRAQEALRESESRYRRLFERNQAGVLRTTLDGRILDANPAAVRILGLDPTTDVSGHSMKDHHENLEARQKLLEELRREGEVRNYELVLRRADDTRFHALLSLSLVTESSEDSSAIEGTLIDVTERHQAEEELRQAQKLDAVGQLASGVAHDFNNLLQVGMGLTELLREIRGEPDQLGSAADELESLFERGAALTRQLLLFSRRETAHPEPTDLNEIVRGISGMLRRLLKENIEIRLDLAEESLGLTADRGQLEQVVTNLALNAADAMPEGGVLTLRTGSAGRGRVWLSVTDTGVGMSEQVRERIFEPFFTTKGAGKGTGLGLAVVHGIVTSHGGAVEVDSGSERGTTFRMSLPGLRPEEYEAVPQAAARRGPLPEGRGELVLVVEDQEPVRAVLRRMLSRLGYHLTEAESAEEALGLPFAPQFDLLISDVVLPGKTGVQLSEELRQRWPGLKVVLMSGYAEDQGLDTAAKTGGTVFLHKPFDLEELARASRSLLDGSE